MFTDFKPVLKILLRFVVIYIVLVFGYQLYLNQFKGLGLDPVSEWVMRQVLLLQNALHYESLGVPGAPQDETTWYYVSGKYVSRMVEGCNAVSVIILFLAFIFAFYQGIKTFLFAAAGVLILHLMNVLRIAGLNILIVEMPQYSKAGHDYLFPALIYGTVVVLWLVWIQYFTPKPARNEPA